MRGTFEVRQGQFGSELVVIGAWHDGIADYMTREGIQELVLNYALGWTDNHIEFLSDLTTLTSLTVIHRTIDNVAPVNGLTKLRALQLDTYCNTPVDFSRMSRLERCNFYWRRGSDSIFSCQRLKRLTITAFPGHFSNAFAELQGLEWLAIYSGPLRDLAGIGQLKHLVRLGLYNLSKLVSLVGIEGCEDLHELEANSCTNLVDIDALSAFARLRRLSLSDSGRIQSLKPVWGMSRLESLFFTGKTRIVDGDLKCLLRLPALREIAFKDRRHYSHTRAAIRKHIQFLEARPDAG